MVDANQSLSCNSGGCRKKNQHSFINSNIKSRKENSPSQPKILLPLPKLRLPPLKLLLPSFALSNERKEISVLLLRSPNTNQPSNPNSQSLLLPYFFVLQIFRFHIPNFAPNRQQRFSKIFYFTNFLLVNFFLPQKPRA